MYTVVMVGSGRDEYVDLHTSIRRDLYERLVKLALKRFGRSERKLYILVNEALEEYLRRRENDDS